MRATSCLAAAAALACGAVTAQPRDGIPPSDVEARILAAGYTRVDDLKLDGGLWEADARTRDGRWVDVRVHPVSGKVYVETTVSRLEAQDVEDRLLEAGYSRIHDVEFDDGVWKADAISWAGVRVEVVLDPDTGSIVSEHED